ncbi:MAG: hypothetical protein ACRDQW_01845, partial [Haloechinothrix sp.]
GIRAAGRVRVEGRSPPALTGNSPGATVLAMATWSEFSLAAPRLASRAHELLYQFGVGLGFLGTVDASGGPRVHPLCPIICDGELYLLVVPGPKRADLERDGRFALHSFPCPDNEDAAYLTGRAVALNDAPERRAMVEQQFLDERSAIPLAPESLAEQTLFLLDVEGCLITTTTGHGDPAPQHEVWRA